MINNKMIDWITARIPIKHKRIPNSGGFIKYDEDGSVVFDIENKLNVEGSSSSSIQVSSDDEAIFFSGNPAKFLQGHNLTGIDNPHKLTRLLLLDLQKRGITDFDFFKLDDAVDNGDLFRIDINFSFALQNNFDVEIFLQTLHHKSKTRHGKATQTGDTVYFGKHSKRWSIKFYNKYKELLTAKEQKKLKNMTAENYNLLMNSSKNIVRAELTLRSIELTELQFKKTIIKDSDLKKHIKNNKNYEHSNFKKLKTWNNGDIAKKIFNNYMNKLEITGQMKLTDEVMLNLPMKLRATYLMWRDGYVLSPDINITKPTYYRHKKLLSAFGINISIPRDTETKANNTVVEFKKVLSAEPVDFLDEFRKHGLIAG
jgi:II/X family phage/plasmid replication protein